jgi:hypothetical protein
MKKRSPSATSSVTSTRLPWCRRVLPYYLLPTQAPQLPGPLVLPLDGGGSMQKAEALEPRLVVRRSVVSVSSAVAGSCASDA